MYEIQTEELEKMKRNLQLSPPMEMYITAIENLLVAEKVLKTTNIDSDLAYANQNAKGFATLVKQIVQKRDNIAIIPSEEKVLDTFELADYCGVSAQTIRKKCESGEIKAKRGKRNQWIIPESELSNPIILKWLEDKETRFTSIKEAQDVLSKSKAFIDGLKEEEKARKAEAEE
ncbi:helix-turn-helix domain-containing protein [Robertmurraya andreesenii]|uniref:Helix-turn-helix domain-containing protein n=1 Tax=Anoxybacillus andreesenii TaxID=1325932 RepID=A0ABT9V6E2_9BACL|nr:helix-turn-helix domain-containing protein [Robertmurraya andreesenii]MDQ0156516.1 hypothetical protein [Robertmurraya andreesenii]